MTLKQFILLMVFGTLLCWFAWISVLVYINPFETSFLGFVFFYFALFLAFTGTLSLLGLAVRVQVNKDEPTFKLVGTSFRHAMLFGLTVVGALFLQSQRLLTWWNVLILLFAVTALELFILSSKKNKTRIKAV